MKRKRNEPNINRSRTDTKYIVQNQKTERRQKMSQNKKKKIADKPLVIFSVIVSLMTFYIALACGAICNRLSVSFGEVLGDGSAILAMILNPMAVIKYANAESILAALWIAFIVAMLLVVFYLEGKRGLKEPSTIHGSARWLHNVETDGKKESEDAKEYRKDMMSEKYTDNIMFDNTYGISMNTRQTLRNLHTLVIGGSGAGKTRFFVKPNILQMNSSYIITDPSGELFRDMGQMLKDNNYDVRVFNTFDTNASMQYNPLMYIDRKTAGTDVTDLVSTFIRNTGEATGDNKYFDDATKLLLTAIILFLIEYCPKSEHDFNHVIQLVVAADVPEGQKNAQSELDKIFEQVEIVDPNSLALKTYNSFKTTAGKTLKAVLSNTAVRLNVFNFPEIERLTCADTISLKTIGDEKTALFIITPPIDNGFNFLVAMMYSQLFSKLYYHSTFECRYLLTDNDYIARPFKSKEAAERVKALLTEQFKNKDAKILDYRYDMMIEKYEMVDVFTGEVLMRELRQETVDRFKNNPDQFIVKQNTDDEQGSPIHIRMIMDEFANINEIPGFQEVLATVRKYNMSVAIILQSLSQLKKRYEKDYDPIIGNCDTFIFLGANSLETAEHINKVLGTMTVFSHSENESYGKGKGYSIGKQEQKKEVMTVQEIQQLPNDQQIVMVRAICPMRLHKFKLEQHPNFKLSADYDKSKRLVLTQCYDLKKKIETIEKMEGVEIKPDNQSEINQRVQRPVDNWINQPIGKNGAHGTNGHDADEFFF
jgi:type IV secretory pathway TraG/TraD family ATPase VirD4